MKATIKNNGNAVRVLNIKDGEVMKQVSIAPGKSATEDFVETKMLAAALDAGTLTKSGGKKAEEKPAA